MFLKWTLDTIIRDWLLCHCAFHQVQDYFQEILLSGGTTMFPGMSSRLEKDIASCVDTLSIEPTRQRKKSTFFHLQGPKGSLLAECASRRYFACQQIQGSCGGVWVGLVSVKLECGTRAWDIIRPSAWGSPTPTAHGFLGSIHHGWCLRAAGAHANAKAFGLFCTVWLSGKLQILDFQAGISGMWGWPSRHDLPNHVFAWDELVSTLTTLNVTIWHRQ